MTPNLQSYALNAATAAVEQALNRTGLQNHQKQRSISIASNTTDKFKKASSETDSASKVTTSSFRSEIDSLSTRKKSDASDVSSTFDSENVFYTDENKEFKEKLEEFKTANYCSIDEINAPNQSDNAIEYVELNNAEDAGNPADKLRVPSPPPIVPEGSEDLADKSLNKQPKKQPPPVMKKPEKSDDILRKLGRGSALDSVSQQTFGTVSSVSSTSSSVHDPVSISTSISSSTNETSIRLPHSKATDV